MSRILFVFAATAPTVALAHVGQHDSDATGTLFHNISQPDHALNLIAALTLPVAAAVLTLRRGK